MGQLKIVAAGDLGGLGETTGPPVFRDWSPWDHLRLQSPAWIVLLFCGLLLGLKSNRRARVWWVWAPCLASWALAAAAQDWLGRGPFTVVGVLLENAVPLLVAWTLVWLVMPQLSLRSRWGTAAVTLGVMVLGGLFGTVASTGEIPLETGQLAFLGIALLTPLPSIGLAAILSPGKRGPLSFGLAWLGCTVGSWLALCLPLQLLCTGSVDAGSVGDVAAGAGAQFLLLLPYPLLAWLEPFHRARFTRWLQLADSPEPRPCGSTATDGTADTDGTARGA